MGRPAVPARRDEQARRQAQAGLLRGPARREYENRITVVDQRHWSVLEFRAGESLGWMPQVSLNLSAASIATASPVPRPITNNRSASTTRRSPDSSPAAPRAPAPPADASPRLQLAIGLPRRHQARAGGKLRDVALGGRDACFRAGVQRKHPLRGARQRRRCVIDERDRKRAAVAKKRIGATRSGFGRTGKRKGHQVVAGRRDWYSVITTSAATSPGVPAAP